MQVARAWFQAFFVYFNLHEESDILTMFQRVSAWLTSPNRWYPLGSCAHHLSDPFVLEF